MHANGRLQPGSALIVERMLGCVAVQGCATPLAYRDIGLRLAKWVIFEVARYEFQQRRPADGHLEYFAARKRLASTLSVAAFAADRSASKALF